MPEPVDMGQEFRIAQHPVADDAARVKKPGISTDDVGPRPDVVGSHEVSISTQEMKDVLAFIKTFDYVLDRLIQKFTAVVAEHRNPAETAELSKFLKDLPSVQENLWMYVKRLVHSDDQLLLLIQQYDGNNIDQGNMQSLCITVDSDMTVRKSAIGGIKKFRDAIVTQGRQVFEGLTPELKKSTIAYFNMLQPMPGQNTMNKFAAE